jgi:hypothetical protein
MTNKACCTNCGGSEEVLDLQGRCQRCKGDGEIVNDFNGVVRCPMNCTPPGVGPELKKCRFCDGTGYVVSSS